MTTDLKNQLKNYHFLRTASEIAGEVGSEVYVVGGFIRDFILGRDVEDIDFMIIGDVVKYARKFANSVGVDDIIIYKNFGTAHFNYQGINLEFVAARKESYSKSSRKPIVAEGTFYDDISRRDFTINTIAMDIKSKNNNIIDIFGGEADLKKGIIRTPLDPMQTFSDGLAFR